MKLEFRVWNKKKKNWNAETEDGHYSWDTEGITLNGLVEYIQSRGNFVIQRFTGLLDINGRKIFEGDIVKTLSSDNGYHSEVVWDDHEGRWGFKSINLIHPERSGKTISYNLGYGCSGWRVIGNIFDNPELL